MKLITLIVVLALPSLAYAANKPLKKARDLSRVSTNCVHAETKTLKERCKNTIKKDLSRVKFNAKKKKLVRR